MTTYCKSRRFGRYRSKQPLEKVDLVQVAWDRQSCPRNICPKLRSQPRSLEAGWPSACEAWSNQGHLRWCLGNSLLVRFSDQPVSPVYLLPQASAHLDSVSRDTAMGGNNSIWREAAQAYLNAALGWIFLDYTLSTWKRVSRPSNGFVFLKTNDNPGQLQEADHLDATDLLNTERGNFWLFVSTKPEHEWRVLKSKNNWVKKINGYIHI